ncbi:hypothetical protein Y032_0016g2998 [Ancylostoma ceylanicum]|uniref:Uncharacterized protein n=1 Tax=Ancylostoma ceylanicum TaxID=53326 RepID=A0A016V5C1_9BILA|nr:hypothetical protein Y032_0016g2998 [Ancylostoma ceylanicum]
MNRVIRPLQICVKDPRDRSPGNTSVRFSKGTEIFLCWRLKIFLDACSVTRFPHAFFHRLHFAVPLALHLQHSHRGTATLNLGGFRYRERQSRLHFFGALWLLGVV